MASLRVQKLWASGGRTLLVGMALTGPSVLFAPVLAQEKGYGQTISSPQQERELDYGTGTNRGGSALDSTNPWELMNKLRKATALDDATQPSDAVDEALKDFDSQSSPPAKASPAATVKGP